MSDLIDRRAAIDTLMEILDRPNHAEFLYTDEICKALSAMPSAQPARKTGRWIVFPAPDEQHCGLVKCPYCQEELIAEPTEYHYCPNCGCKMEVG